MGPADFEIGGGVAGGGVIYREKMTGRSRHRTDDAGLLILQVEVSAVGRYGLLPPRWRDAKVEDLSVQDSIPEVVA